MKKILITVILTAMILAACTSENDVAEKAEHKETPAAEIQISPTPSAVLMQTPTKIEDQSSFQIGSEFRTDFSKRSVSFDEIRTGGPPKDGIPSIENPKHVSIQEADEWIDSVEPVIALEIQNQARAYPIQILMWHEIVNDFLGGEAVAITFCPLCNTAIVFDREIDGRVYDFGTTGRLRYSNLIMYDRQTETWWQQGTGEAIIGELLGTQLDILPGALISWADFKASHPDGDVLSRETGFNRSYGTNPYSGYDDVGRPPFLYDGPELPDVLPPVERVFTVDEDGIAVAYPYRILEVEQVINDTVGVEEIVVMWNDGTASALDNSEIALGRDVGAANAFYREIDGKVLTFTLENREIVDLQTGTTWNILGLGIKGEMMGKQLRAVGGINHFWFSWAAFRPDTQIYGVDY